MFRSLFAARLHQVFGASTSGNRREVRRLKKHRSLQVESLEGRALMATINAAATPTSTAPVTVTDVTLMENREHVVTQIIVDYSGPVNSSEAESIATYRLATPGKNGSFTAKNAMVLKLKSAAYDAALDSVTLTPKQAFALTKPVQLVINGQSLEDSTGQLIDGGNDGQSGSDYVTILQRTATAVTPALAPKTARSTPAPETILRRTIVMRAPSPTSSPVSLPMPGAAPTPMPIFMPSSGY
jgi:hypothetical protein